MPLVAAVLIFQMVVWMRCHGAGLKRELRLRLAAAERAHCRHGAAGQHRGRLRRRRTVIFTSALPATTRRQSAGGGVAGSLRWRSMPG
jgi:high-affinity iron transporter